jgi:hypothetical protein
LTATVTTAATTLNKGYRKIQGKLLKGLQTLNEEWDLLDDIPDYDVTLSAREMTVPIRLNSAGRSAYIAEGALEKNPVTPPVEELTLTWANLNERWMTTLTAKYLDKYQAGQVIRQLKYQALEALDAISNTVSWQFYGFSTGVMCQTTTVATQASGAYTLANAFGISALGGAAYLASMFTIYDRVALIRTGALVANAIGSITAVDTTNGTITVTWLGSVTSASGDNIVFANSMENTTIAGTDYNLAPVGLLDAVTSTSVHGLSGSSVANSKRNGHSLASRARSGWSWTARSSRRAWSSSPRARCRRATRSSSTRTGSASSRSCRSRTLVCRRGTTGTRWRTGTRSSSRSTTRTQS